MKKALIILLACILSLGIIACGKSSSTQPGNYTSDEGSKKEEVKVDEKLNTKTLDGLTLTIISKIENVKGDRTQDNYAKENGEYFANGSDIVKASDYKNIVVTVDIENNTDKALPFGVFNWSAELQDGYELNQNFGDNSGNDQVQAKSKGSLKLSFIVKNDIKAEKIKVSYLWIKNEDEFNRLLSDPNMANMTKEEVAKKYIDVFESIELQTDIQK